VQFVLSFPAFFLSLALIDEVDPSLELTPLGHFTQKKAMSRKKRTHSSGTGSTRYMPPLGYSPGPLLIAQSFLYIAFYDAEI
jgi:hypothetical protein